MQIVEQYIDGNFRLFKPLNKEMKIVSFEDADDSVLLKFEDKFGNSYLDSVFKNEIEDYLHKFDSKIIDVTPVNIIHALPKKQNNHHKDILNDVPDFREEGDEPEPEDVGEIESRVIANKSYNPLKAVYKNDLTRSERQKMKEKTKAPNQAVIVTPENPHGIKEEIITQPLPVVTKQETQHAEVSIIKPITGISSLREDLIATLNGIKQGTVKPEQAKLVLMASNSILNCFKTEMMYSKLLNEGEINKIGFMDNHKESVIKENLQHRKIIKNAVVEFLKKKESHWVNNPEHPEEHIDWDFAKKVMVCRALKRTVKPTFSIDELCMEILNIKKHDVEMYAFNDWEALYHNKKCNDWIGDYYFDLEYEMQDVATRLY